MNRLTRIYGLKCRHCLHELTGSMTLYLHTDLLNKMYVFSNG